MISIDDYRGVVGDQVLYELYQKARKLNNKHLLNFNSTAYGGGVAEILNSMVPLMNDIGVGTGWRVLAGEEDFFQITKSFHNGLQGAKEFSLSDEERNLYLEVNQQFSIYTHIWHDFVVVHDPQPLPLIKYYTKKQPWVWRCHIDFSNPNPKLWEFLKQFVLRYDVVIVSHEKYKKKDLPVRQVVIPPAINPLSTKNCDMTTSHVKEMLKKFGVPTDKPIITQISRFDKWKDPIGVLKAFEEVKKKVDCRLVLCGNMAADDPEGVEIYNSIHAQAADLVKRGDVIFITVSNNYLVNALQRASAVIIQKSLKEGFGLTVTEALWKGTPVVAGDVGGIPLQIDNEKNGFLVNPTDIHETAARIVDLLKNDKLREQMGIAGKEKVKKKFLITRLMNDYLDLAIELL